MLIASFALFSFYRQIEVFGSIQEEHAGTLWTDRHVRQGFVSLPRSVGFGLLQDVGDQFVEVHRDTIIRAQPTAVRAIVVPYTVPPDGRVEVSDCVNVVETSFPAGDYALLFETGYTEGTGPADYPNAKFWVRLTFVSQQDVQPALLVADEDLSPTYPLLLGF